MSPEWIPLLFVAAVIAMLLLIIARLMHGGRALTPKNVQFAARHGRRRKKDGYTLAMLMREFQLIGETITNCMARISCCSAL